MSEVDKAQQPGRPRLRRLGRYLLLSLLLVTLVGATVGGIWWWRTSQAVQRRLDQLEKDRLADSLVDRDPPGDPHPLDPAIDFARQVLNRFHSQVDSYSATMVKQERIAGQLYPRTTMFTKVREQRDNDGQPSQPLSIYVRFDEPPAQRGREVIWVKGQNEGKIIVHEGGLLGFKRLLLEPTGVLAMAGGRYPVTDAGIERLLIKMLNRSQRDRAADGESQLVIEHDVLIETERCVRIVISHPIRDERFDFQRAVVEIEADKFRYLRYAAYDWPAEAGQQGELIEEYIYQQVVSNPGLQDSDFDPDNPLYKFP
jgi:hypothetical protein